MACNSSSVNVSISFHADKISSIIVLYGSPFPIHKLKKVMMIYEFKPVGWTTDDQRSKDQTRLIQNLVVREPDRGSLVLEVYLWIFL